MTDQMMKMDGDSQFHRDALAAGYDLYLTCDFAPVQVEGRAQDRPVYYRARHNKWRLELGDVTIEGVGEPGAELVLHVLAFLYDGADLPAYLEPRICSWSDADTFTRVCAHDRCSWGF